MKSRKIPADVLFEIQFLEGVLKYAPHFEEALIILGDNYTRAGRWTEGLEVDRKLSLLRPSDPYVLYNLACSYALLQELPAAVEALKKAVELGYDDFDHLEKDPDLEHLRADEHFRLFWEGLKRRNPG